MEAYAAVHNQEQKEEITSSRDAISEMNLSPLTDNDLNEIVEEVLEDIFEAGFSVDEAYNIFADMFVESEIVGRQQKIDRLCEALNQGFELVESKASTVAIEEFRKHRHGKKLQETWSDRLQQDKRIKKQHSAVVAQESLNVRNLLVQLFNEKKADKDYDGDGKVESGKDEYMGSRDKAIKKAMGKNPAVEMEKKRKDDDLFGSPNKKKVNESMKQARKNVGASTCWDGYKAKGTKKKGGKEVPNCVKEEELQEKDGLYANIHAKKKRIASGSGEKMRKPGSEGAPTAKAFKDSEKTAKKEEVTYEGAGYATDGGASPMQHTRQMKKMAGASDRKVQVGKANAALNRPMKNKMENLEWSQDEIDAIEAKVASWND